MAHENETNQAESGTSQQNGCPAWDNIGQGQLPFFNPTEEKKRAGIRVKFMTDGPRKETVNRYDPKNPKPELWFDVELIIFNSETKQNVITMMTWTISQIYLYTECSLKYKFQYIDKIPRPFISSGLAFGSTVHSALEWMHKEMLKGRKVSFEKFEKIFKSDWYCQKIETDLRFKNSDSWETLLLKGKEILNLYFKNTRMTKR